MPVRALATATLLILFSLPATAQITNGVTLFKGVVNDSKSGQPVDGGRVYVYQGTLEEPVTNSKINPGTGKYQVLLNPSTEYRFVFKSPKYYNTEIMVTSPPNNDYEEVVRDFTMEPIPVGSTIYSGRLFDPGSAELKISPEFQKLTDLMKREIGIMLGVVIIPDAMAPEVRPAPKAKPAKKKKGKKGAAEPAEAPVETPAPQAMTPEQLKALGQERAVAIRNHFKSLGISTTRLEWDVREGRILPGGKSGEMPENVVVSIRKIEVEDEDE
jgi:hypothetical protein